jgi:hypothetical protein
MQFCFTKINSVAINLNIFTSRLSAFPAMQPANLPAVGHFASKPSRSEPHCLTALCMDGSLTHFPLSPVSAELLRERRPGLLFLSKLKVHFSKFVYI